MLLLAGDIGGTKSGLGIYSPEDGIDRPIETGQRPSSEYDSLEDLVRDFLESVSLTPQIAAFGIAGPVVDERVEVTNLPWVVDASRLQSGCGFTKVGLLNDLEAVAYAVPSLQKNDVETLQAGQPNKTGNIGVVAPGTGLGEAFLTWSGNGYQAHASEGGHADFAPTTPLQSELLQYLQPKFDHISYENVCSGHGIPNIYNFLKNQGHAEEPDWLSNELASRDDPTPIIISNAMRNDPPTICKTILDIFVSILAAEAGNLALKLISTGGLYLGGGIPSRILAALRTDHFLRSFRRKGRFDELMQEIPVHVIVHPKAALLGAASYGMGLI